jgi:hypothetical protein
LKPISLVFGLKQRHRKSDLSHTSINQKSIAPKESCKIVAFFAGICHNTVVQTRRPPCGGRLHSVLEAGIAIDREASFLAIFFSGVSVSGVAGFDGSRKFAQTGA